MISLENDCGILQQSVRFQVIQKFAKHPVETAKLIEIGLVSPPARLRRIDDGGLDFDVEQTDGMEPIIGVCLDSALSIVIVVVMRKKQMRKDGCSAGVLLQVLTNLRQDCEAWGYPP